MLVEINSLDNGSGVNTNLDIYAGDTRPFCRIDENDFFELMSEKAIAAAEKGEVYFNIPKNSLIGKSNKIYDLNAFNPYWKRPVNKTNR